VIRIGCIIGIILDWVARVFSRDHIVEDSETVSTARVCSVISELSHSLVLGADVGVGVWTNCMDLQVIPESISVRATTSVLNECIIRTSDPIASWRLIRVE